MEKSYGSKFANRAAEVQKVVDDVLKRFPNIITFQEAASWQSDTHALIRLLDQFCTDILSYKSEQEEFAKQAESVRSNLPLFKRTFASRSEEKQYLENINSAEKTISSIDDAILHLQDLLERMPVNKLEQKQMLQELRLRKKELTTEKRAVNENMRQIRTDARQKMTNWTGAYGSGFTGSVARYKRVRIRNQKENSLAPQENAKTAIEKQIIETEKDINRISKITGDEPIEQRPVIRCAYCGRRVNQNGICPGCGSDKTETYL